jgi:hypothetical protein
MAFDRMKALETYLQSCKDLPNFTEILEQQAVMLVKEIRNLGKLDLQEGAPLLALVQQNTLWTKDLKETIAKSIQHKVQESMQKQGTVTTRCQLQNFTYFPIYLTQEDWDCVLNPSKPVAVKIHTVLERLFRLGLKAPSEDTQAMLTVCMLLTDQSRLFDNLQLRSAYLAVKQLVKQFLKARKDSDSGDFFPDLPACSKAIEDERRGNGYRDGEQPADLPSGITMEFFSVSVDVCGSSAVQQQQHRNQRAQKHPPWQVPTATWDFWPSICDAANGQLLCWAAYSTPSSHAWIPWWMCAWSASVGIPLTSNLELLIKRCGLFDGL